MRRNSGARHRSITASAGLLSQHEARHLIVLLRRDPTPPANTPDVPWAVTSRATDGSWIAACSTMWSTGLFWTVRAGVPFVGLHPRDVLQQPTPQPWSLDPDWLLAFLDLNADPSGSPYRGLRRLLPGQTLAITAAGVPTVTNWANPVDPPPPTLDARAAVREYRAAFATVIPQGLARCGPVTAEVSGGLDSTFVAASLARSHSGEVVGFTAVPLPDVPASRPGWVVNDLPDASLLVQAYPNLRIEPVSNRDRRTPLSAADDAGSRSWWPSFATANQVWLDQIADAARDRGSTAVWAGRNGNFSFSREPIGAWRHHLSRHEWSSAARLILPPGGARHPVAWAHAVRRNLEAARLDRHKALQQIHGQRFAYGANSNPCGGSPILLDPFRSRAVTDVASRMTPTAWDNWLLPRGFAREVGRDRVPDGIRLRKARGMQAADVWLWIYDRRDEYLDRVSVLADVPAVGASLAEAPVLRTVSAWPWGDAAAAPPLLAVTVVNRLLAMADFVRLTDTRLRSLAVTGPSREAPAD